MENLFVMYDQPTEQPPDLSNELMANIAHDPSAQSDENSVGEWEEGDDKFEEMEDLGLICAVCMEPYDLPPSTKTPKALPCLHTFCLDCCQTLSRIPHSNTRVASIACPQCRRVSPLATGAEGLPNNFALLSIIKRAHCNPSSGLNCLPNAAARIEVSVTDPVKVGFGIKAFTSFKVSCEVCTFPDICVEKGTFFSIPTHVLRAHSRSKHSTIQLRAS